MYRFIQRNKKKLIAVFGVVLMVAFILPFGVGNFGQTDPATLPFGKMGDRTITRADVGRAGADLDVLFRAGFAPLAQLGEPPQPFFMGGRPQGRAAAMLRDKPETYALLQQEARAAGVAPAADEVNGLYTQYFSRGVRSADDAEAYRGAVERFLLVRDHFQRVTADVKVTAPIVRSLIARDQQATLNVVEFAAEEFVAQVPEPPAEQVQAHYNQYATVAPPQPSMALPATQPVAFGYKRPDRVKLQYLELPQDRVVEAVLKSFAPEELLPLDRVGYVHYEANPQDFQTTAAPPATTPTAATAPAGPMTNPTTGPTTGPAATSPATAPATAPTTATAPAAPARPTTRPFDDATKVELRRKLLTGAIQPPAAAPADDLAAVRAMSTKLQVRVDELQSKLRDQLLSDFQVYKAGGTVTLNALAGPSTRPAPQFDKLEYLEAVATEFEKAFGVRPMVTSLANEWLTRDKLAGLTGIGNAFTGEQVFAELATRHAPLENTPATAPTTAPPTTSATTVPTSSPATAAVSVPATAPTTTAAVPTTMPGAAKPALALFEPSPLLRDQAGNAYVFRLTAFEGERVPPLDEVREQIVKDLKLTAAYAEARKQAETFRSAAGSSAAGSPTGGLPIPAGQFSRKLVVAGPLSPRTMDLPGYDLTGDMAAQQTFMMSAMGLLGRATADQPHPSTLVELPAQRKVVAVELRALERSWTAAQDAANQARALDDARIQLFRDRTIDMALLNWFDFDTVAKRTAFTRSDRG